MAPTDRALVLVARIVSGGAPASSVRMIGPLEGEVLQGGLDDDVRLGRKGIEGRGDPQPRDDGLDVRALRWMALKTAADPRHRRVERRRVDVMEDHVVAGRQDHLGDARTHRPGPDDADRGHTRFIASNGWRQSRQ